MRWSPSTATWIAWSRWAACLCTRRSPSTRALIPILRPSLGAHYEEVSIDKGIDVWANFGTHYFLERREIGIFNIGDGAGTVTADGKEYHLNYKDCLYLTKGNQKVTFKSDDPEHPAKFYMVSAPAHCSYENKLITIEQAAKRPLGSVETCNKRTINQFIHPSVLKTCQLSMGMTALEPGSNWNTMPSHTHERRMEIYTYFEVPD